jgi:hypothetical protein
MINVDYTDMTNDQKARYLKVIGKIDVAYAGLEEKEIVEIEVTLDKIEEHFEELRALLAEVEVPSGEHSG